MPWSSGDSINSTNLNNQHISNLTVDGTLSASIRLGSGTSAAPSLSMLSDPTVGFSYSGTSTLRLDGRLGIWTRTGVASPYHVALEQSGGGGGGAGFQGWVNPGSAITSGQRLGFYTFGGVQDNANTYYTSAAVESYTVEDWTTDAAGSDLRFKVTSAGTDSARVEYMRLDSSGISVVGTVATATPSANSHAATKAYVDGQLSAVSPANVVDGSFPGEYSFSRTTSTLTIGKDVKALNQYLANVVGPQAPALVGSQRSFGFGFSQTNNYPMVALSAATQSYWDGTYLHQTSGISMVNSSGNIQTRNGTASAPPLIVGEDTDAGFFYNATTNQLCSSVSGAQAWSVLSTNGGVAFTAGTPTSSINEMDVLCATAGTAKIGLGSTVGSGTSTAIIAQNTSTDAFTIQLRKLPSLLSTLFKLTHPSAGSGTGLYVLDVSNPAFDPIEVEIMPNDTGGTGYRALVVANS